MRVVQPEIHYFSKGYLIRRIWDVSNSGNWIGGVRYEAVRLREILNGSLLFCPHLYFLLN